jgi:hypothetical protein
LPQNQVGMMTWIVDVVKDGCATNLTGIVNDDVAKS